MSNEVQIVKEQNDALIHKLHEIERSQENRIDYSLYIDKKLQEQEKKFEKRLQDCENLTLSKVYYFRTFRWRILRNKGNLMRTQIGGIQFIQDIDYTGLNYSGASMGSNFRYIRPDMTKVKITYNGVLDEVICYNQRDNKPFSTENKKPVIYIRFPGPVQLKQFEASAHHGSDNRYDNDGFPEEWVFEGSNDEMNWVTLHETSEASKYTTHSHYAFHRIRLPTSP